jgi:lysozyme
MDWTDKTCTAGRVKAMVGAGFDIIGFYHFARPQPGRAPEVEARHFVNHVKSVHGLRPKGTILALDIEWVQGLGTAQLRSWVKGWLQEVERLTGIRPIIYTGAWFWNPRLGNPRTFFGRYALWLSAYVKNPAPFVPAAWKDGWTMWQYSDKGHVDGISSPCDVSTFHGSIHDLQRLAA